MKDLGKNVLRIGAPKSLAQYLVSLSHGLGFATTLTLPLNERRAQKPCAKFINSPFVEFGQGLAILKKIVEFPAKSLTWP
jgi:hypothetical protein